MSKINNRKHNLRNAKKGYKNKSPRGSKIDDMEGNEDLLGGISSTSQNRRSLLAPDSLEYNGFKWTLNYNESVWETDRVFEASYPGSQLCSDFVEGIFGPFLNLQDRMASSDSVVSFEEEFSRIFSKFHLIQFTEIAELNLASVPVEHYNLALKKMLPRRITLYLTPLKTFFESPSVYESLSIALFGVPIYYECLRAAVIYFLSHNSDEFFDVCKSFGETFEDIREIIKNGTKTSQTELGLLSRMIKRAIIIFKFNANGEEVISNFATISSEENEFDCVYLGQIRSSFFPFVRSKSRLGNPVFLIKVNPFLKEAIDLTPTDITTDPGNEETGVSSASIDSYDGFHADVEVVLSDQCGSENDGDFTDGLPPFIMFPPFSDLYYERYFHNNPIDEDILKSLFPNCKICDSTKRDNCPHELNEMTVALIEIKKILWNTDIGMQTKADVDEFIYSNVPIEDSCVKEEKCSLPKHLENKFTAFSVTGEGNCFFDAVSFCLFSDVVLGKCLRRLCYIELATNCELQERFKQSLGGESNVNKLLQRIKTDGNFSNAHVVETLSSAILRDIIIVSAEKAVKFKSKCLEVPPANPVYCFFSGPWCAGHYTPLIPVSETARPDPEAFPTHLISRKTEKKKGDDKHCFTSATTDNFDCTSNATESIHSSKESESNSMTLQNKNKEIPTTFQEVNAPAPSFSQKYVRHSSTGMFMNDVFANVLQQFVQKIQGLMQNRDSSKLKEFLANCVKAPKTWKELLEKCILSSHYRNKLNSLYIMIYKKQRFLLGRQKIASQLKLAGASTRLVEFYFEQCDNKFGKLIPQNVDSTVNENKPPLIDFDAFAEDKSGSGNNFGHNSAKEETEFCGRGQDLVNTSESMKSGSISAGDGNSESDVDLDDWQVSKQAVCAILNTDTKSLSHRPPPEFEILIDSREFLKVFDFKQSQFIAWAYPIVIDKAVNKMQQVCSYNSTSGSRYNKKKSFCVLYGRCDCKMQFIVQILSTPVPGIDVRASVRPVGRFTLNQIKSSGRQVRNFERVKAAKYLETRTAKEVYLESLENLPAPRVLHRNFPFKSEDAIRKIKSESNVKNRLGSTEEEKIKALQQKLNDKDQIFGDKNISGYVQYFNTELDYFTIYLYSNPSLTLHLDQIKRGFVTIHLDASGGFIKKFPKKKSPLLYVLNGRTNDEITYHIGEFLSVGRSATEVGNFLRNVRKSLKKLNPGPALPFTQLVVVDWSFALIHGVLDGLNYEKLEDYLDRSFMFLNEKSLRWDPTKSCIFICTSHLMHAVKILLSKKLSMKQKRHSNEPSTLDLCLDGVAKLHEALNFDEFSKASQAIIRLLGIKQLPKKELDETIAFVSTKKTDVEQLLTYELTEAEVIEDDDIDKQAKTLREKSKFSQIFSKHRHQLLNSDTNTCDYLTVQNPHYCVDALDALEIHKIPLWPLWSFAVARGVYGVKKLRTTNAVAESHFNLRKNLISRSKNQRYPDFCLQSFRIHKSLSVAALDKLHIKRSKPRKVDPLNDTELITEGWDKKRSAARKSKFLSQISRTVPIKTTERTIDKPVIFKNVSTGMENSRNLNEGLPLPKRGIANLGSTCFISASMQLMMRIPLLHTLWKEGKLDYLKPYFDSVYGNGIDKADLKIAYKTLLRRLDWLNAFDGIRPIPVKCLFKEGAQHDAQEFFLKLQLLPELNPIVQLLRFKFVETLMCQKCNNSRQVPIIKEYTTGIEFGGCLPTIEEEIKHLFNNSDTGGKTNCEFCLEATPHFQSRVLMEAPLFLIVLLKIYDEKGKKQKGLQNEPLNLTVPTMTGVAEYSLKAFVSHAGMYGCSINFGHYLAYLYDDGVSYECNDESVRQGKINRNDIYIILYQRK